MESRVGRRINQANGTLPDSTYWNYDIGTGQWGWGNNESQYYTSRSENARIVNGQLLIEMHKETTTVVNIHLQDSKLKTR